MQKQFKTHKPKLTNDAADQQSEEFDLRLQRQIKLTSKLQNSLNQCKEQFQFCTQYLGNLRQQHQSIKQHSLFGKINHFGGWQTKLKQLSLKSFQHEKGFSQSQVQNKPKKDSKLASCSQKNHLEEILDQKSRKDEEEQIARLEQKLKGLESKIQKMVIQEFMNDKIMNKIRRESRKISKLKTIQFMQKEISKYKNWVDQNTNKINNQIAAKNIQEKIVFNLQLMKLLMSKKIINNDYVYQQFVDKQSQNLKNVQNVMVVANKIQQNYQSIIKTFKNQTISSDFESQSISLPKKQGKKAEKIQIKTVTDYLSQVQFTLFNIQKYDSKQEIQQKCIKLEKRLDQLIRSLKK